MRVPQLGGEEDFFSWQAARLDGASHADLVAEDRGARPILLLDEIAAHLDPLRRRALFDRLGAAGGQVWMTGTERTLFGALPGATWLHVASGTATPD